MKLALTLIFYFIVVMVYSQVPVIQWEKTYGGSDEDKFNSICIKNDTTYNFIGSTKSSGGYIINNHGHNDVWIVQTDQLGTLLWNRCYGGNGSEKGNDLIYAERGEFIIAAEAGDNGGDVTGVHNDSEDFWIIKIDSVGNIIWKDCYGGSQNEYVASIIETFDRGYLVTGRTGSNDYDIYGNHGSDDIWVLKLDSMGLIQWSKPLGSTGYDFAKGNRTCIQLIDSSYLVVGSAEYSNGNVSGNHGGMDIWVVKLNQSGQLLWQRCYGGSSLDNGYGIIASNNNGFYVTGTTLSNDGDVNSSIGGGDIWLIKADSTGVIIWEKCFGGTFLEESSSLCRTSDGGIAIMGNSHGSNGQVSDYYGYQDFWVVKVDSLGNFEWGKVLGGGHIEEATAIAQTPDGGYLVTGYTESSNGHVSTNLGYRDAWVVKLSPPGLSINDPEYSIMDIAVFQRDNILNTRFFSRVNEEVQLEVYNLAGQKIAEQSVRINEGINYFALPGNYKAGSYCLKIGGRNYMQSKVFVVAN